MNLWSNTMPYENPDSNQIPVITEYPAGSKGAVVVLPGGGYGHLAEHEGKIIAEWLNTIGVTAFVLEYRLAPDYKNPAMLCDVQRAIRLARSRAGALGFDKNKVAVMGFSAGGHLAGSASVHYAKRVYEPTDEIDTESARPDASILCYSVIDMFEYRHDGSRQNLLGSRPLHADKELMSLHKQVTIDTPPAFLWHTAADQAVPVENTLLYASALSKVKVPFEVHIYPYGSHGLGLAKADKHVARWSASLDKWLDLMEWK
ncbi:MAG: alpha/beta hydrolase [bacterium]|nr:alpha/beta hydrolase [bacterium]